MAKQPEAKVKFSVLNKEFNDGMAEINRESTKLRKEFKLQEEQLKQNGSASDLLSNKINRLSSEQELTRKKIKLTEEQLAKAKQHYGENSNEANKLSNKLLDLRISEQKLENAISGTKAELNKQSQAMEDTAKDAKKLSDALAEVGDKAKDIGGKFSTGVTLPLAGMGLAAGKTAVDIDGAVRLLNGSLGTTGEEAKQLEEDLRTVWTDGFGDNPEDAARAMMLVKQNIQGINDGEPLQEATKDILTLAKVTDSDVSEATRGINQLMHNFGLTSQEAMDLFAKGQAEGLNYSQEMFDNVSEYAPLFKQMGFSAEEYFTILANGSQNGAYNLDYINDLMKEFDIRARDGSKTTAEAFEGMSQSTQDMFQKFLDGKATTQELFDVVIPELEKMDDQVLANQIGVDLFGTKFEDMGAKTVFSLNDVNTSLQNTKGSMDALAQSQEESFGMKLQSSLRSIGAALEPVGIILLNMLMQVTPYLERFALWFQNLSPGIQRVVVVIGGLLAILGPLISFFGFFLQGVMPIINVVTKLWSWISKLAPVFKVLRIVMLALTGPVGIVIAIITALVTAIVLLWQKNEAFRNAVTKAWNWIKDTAVKVFNYVISFFQKWGSTILAVVTGPIGALALFIYKNFDSIKSKAQSIFSKVKDFMTNPIQNARDTILGIIDKITGAFSKMKITIPKPKLPKIDISTAYKEIAGISIPYPRFNVNWHKTGGVMTQPFIAGNAGFGDVEEGIVPFEGPHAMKIAKLIAAAQNKLSNAKNNLVDKVSNNILQVNIEAADVVLNKKSVGKVMWKPIREETVRHQNQSARTIKGRIR